MFWRPCVAKACRMIPGSLGMVLLTASSGFATQAHGGLEGIVVHQAGHLFFMISMATFAFWLRGSGLARRGGWKEIYYAALFFVLWNFDVICVHLLDEQFGVVVVSRLSEMEYRIDSGSTFLNWFYFLGKHDHLFCVPALFFFYKGVKVFLRDEETSGEAV